MGLQKPLARSDVQDAIGSSKDEFKQYCKEDSSFIWVVNEITKVFVPKSAMDVYLHSLTNLIHQANWAQLFLRQNKFPTPEKSNQVINSFERLALEKKQA